MSASVDTEMNDAHLRAPASATPSEPLGGGPKPPALREQTVDEAYAGRPKQAKRRRARHLLKDKTMLASVAWSKSSQPEAALATLIQEGQEELQAFDDMREDWDRHGKPRCPTCNNKHAPPCMNSGQAEALSLKRVLLRDYIKEQDASLLIPDPAPSEAASADEEEPPSKKKKRNRRCKRCHLYHAGECNLPKCERCASYHLPHQACQLSRAEVQNYASLLSSANPQAAAEVGKILNARVAPKVSSTSRRKRKGKTGKKEEPTS